jgi:hypothetical protein
MAPDDVEKYRLAKFTAVQVRISCVERRNTRPCHRLISIIELDASD